MRTIAVVTVALAGCLSGGPEAAPGVYQVQARDFDSNATSCSDAGKPTMPATPFFQLELGPDGRLAWAWCVKPERCDNFNSADWFVADDDHWLRAFAFVAAAPDEGPSFCALNYDTLWVERDGDMVHVDLLRRFGHGPAEGCTQERAIAELASKNCELVDRYDLVPL
jgi:hypothetical protein